MILSTFSLYRLKPLSTFCGGVSVFKNQKNQKIHVKTQSWSQKVSIIGKEVDREDLPKTGLNPAFPVSQQNERKAV